MLSLKSLGFVLAPFPDGFFYVLVYNLKMNKQKTTHRQKQRETENKSVLVIEEYLLIPQVAFFSCNCYNILWKGGSMCWRTATS